MTKTATPTPATTLRAIVDELADQVYERKGEIEVLVTSLLAGKNAMMIGRPGIAKTWLIDLIASRVTNARSRIFLLDKQMPLEALFGPYDVTEFANGRMVRRTKGFIPELDIVGLDEIGKSNGASINPLLTAVNERQFDDDGQRKSIPLLWTCAATNEYLPPELEAMNDRFLVRLQVDAIQADANFRQYLTDPLAPSDTPTTIDIEVLRRAVQDEVPQVAVPSQIADKMVRLRKELREKAHADPSDRRWRQSMDLMRARAYLNGRDVVTDDDIEILQHSLWEVPEQREQVMDVVLSATGENRKLVVQFTRVLDDLSAQLQDMQAMDPDARSGPGKDVMAKLRDVTGQIGNAVEKAKREGSASDQLEVLEQRSSEVRAKAIRVLFEGE